MKTRQIRIKLTEKSSEAKISVNGHDITRFCAGLSISATAQKLPEVSLQLLPHELLVEMEGFAEVETLLEDIAEKPETHASSPGYDYPNPT